jgi:proteasome accessory factor C
MIAQLKLLRVLRLIALLKGTPRKAVQQLAQALEITNRSVYRYLNLLEEVGFLIDKDFAGRYFIFAEEAETPDILFSPEEGSLLRQLLLAATPGHLLTDGILKKLYLNSELLPLPDNLLKVQNSRNVRRLIQAIQTRRRVVLQKYHSAHSNTILDRLVEPLELTENYQMLAAFEPETGQRKVFKTERITEVTILEQPQTCDLSVSSLEADPFGMVGPERMPVRLALTSRAAMLLREEFPHCAPLITSGKDSGCYHFAGEVQDWKGIGRFILGLPGEVEVLAPEELKAYLREKVRGWKV